jgi:hypothetical protein
MKVKLKQLSVCPCGFPALDESIPLGTEYNIHPHFKDSFTFICGGCGKQQQLIGVLTDSRTPGGEEGFLPEVLFSEPEPDPNAPKQMLLSEILTHDQLEVVESILRENTDRMDASNKLRRYLKQFKKELEEKGVNSDYLAYVIAYKQWTGGDNGDRVVSFSA